MTSNIPKLILYRKDGPCSLAPHALLTHLSIPFTAVAMQSGPDGVEAADGSLSHVDFLLVNPKGYVPTLTVDGVVVTEMPALLTYITSLVPEKNLLGTEGTMDRVKVTEWLAWLSGTLHNGFAAIWRPNRYSDDVNVHGSISKRGRHVIERGFARIEESLKSREWAVGGDITVIDFHLYVFWRWGKRAGIEMSDLYPHYGRVMQNFERLSGVKKAVSAEGLDLCFA